MSPTYKINVNELEYTWLWAQPGVVDILDSSGVCIGSIRDCPWGAPGFARNHLVTPFVSAYILGYLMGKGGDRKIPTLRRCPGCGRAVYDTDTPWKISTEGHDPTCSVVVAVLRDELAEAAYAGPCPFGYGSCYNGPLCDADPVEGSAGCAYTTAPTAPR